MKKVSEIAKELGVSPQAIYKRINKTFKQPLKQHVHKDEKGKTLIDSEGIEIIRRSFEPAVQQPFKQPFKQPFNNGSQERLIESQAKQIEMMDKQLSGKDKQISEKDIQIQNLQRSIEIMQMLLKKEQEKGQLLIEVQREKEPKYKGIKGWFKKEK